MVIDVTGSKSKLVYRPMPQDDPKQRQPNWLGIWKIREAGGQKPNMKEGLTKTISYFESSPSYRQTA
jgi:UDP-glucuronate decarboxylase